MIELYRNTDPLISSLWIAAGFAMLCWVLSLITKEYSWVDRLWSITPPLFSVHFAGAASFEDARLNLMAGLTVLWGARLTYNFARKGGYKPGGEDYRWEEIQGKIGPVWFQLLNATFLAPFQNFLLLAIVLPSYAAFELRGTSLNALDYLAAAFGLDVDSGDFRPFGGEELGGSLSHARRRSADPDDLSFQSFGVHHGFRELLNPRWLKNLPFVWVETLC